MIDSTPPHISDVIYTDISDISAVIEWTTDEAATGQVAYGTSTDYGQITELNEELTTAHSVTIRGLEPETSYYFKILSCDTNQNEASHQAAQSITTAQAIPVGIEAGCRAPDFTLTTYDGDSITLSDYRGKIVLLNFWALSCGPCKAEMPFLQAAHENQAASGLAVIAVNPSDSTVLIEKFVQENGLTFSIPRDQTRQTAKAYSITAIPRTFFIDTKGIIRKVQTGRFKSEADIEKILNSYDW
jgi:peroxiredoxin